MLRPTHLLVVGGCLPTSQMPLLLLPLHTCTASVRACACMWSLSSPITSTLRSQNVATSISYWPCRDSTAHRCQHSTLTTVGVVCCSVARWDSFQCVCTGPVVQARPGIQADQAHPQRGREWQLHAVLHPSRHHVMRTCYSWSAEELHVL